MKKARLIQRILLGVMIALIVSTAAVGVSAVSIIKRVFRDPGSAFADLPEQTTVTVVDRNTGELVEKNVSVNNDVINILFIGRDNSAERDKKGQGYNTDVLVLAAIDMNKNTATLLSIPRDTKANIRLLDSDGHLRGTKTGKINSAFGNSGNIEKYGFQNTMASVSDLLDGTPIHGYVSINMDGVGKMADLVGGVPITIDVDMSSVGMPKGSQQVLTGDKALNYVRLRHLPGTDGSDLSRTKRQLRFMRAWLGQAKTISLTQVPTLYNESMKFVKTNLTLDQVVALASVLNRMDLDEDLNPISMPYSGVQGGYVIPDETELDKIIQQYFRK